MDEHTAQADRLLGALIGLARAVSKQGKTPDTDGVLLSGLQALNSRAAEPTLRAETDKTHAEKDHIAPECALCAMPCGSTADGDMQAVWNAREPVRAKKAALLQAACAAAQRLRPDENGERREAAMLALYRAVFALGEDWDPEALEAVCEALETAGR